ncbi:50S ribosomal protein L14, chloroplastic [Dendrobium catenatum]|uniref:50S ribosomal protein L14, chloroplastic n=1 Tax=Dendrobium catenatum TaxID=906689 RepID=A0A2I0X0Q6_9ASPA|nr:50S ribosomal protein L14, chloroplastic [Dendrobium catenatum]
MIKPHNLLNVANNIGAQELVCIRIIGTNNHRYAYIRDVIIAVIKEAVSTMSLNI